MYNISMLVNLLNLNNVLLRILKMNFQLLTFFNFSNFVWAVCRGGKYSEDDAKAVMVQILNVVAFCHLQGVVHRDLKPEVSNWITFLFQ